MADKIIAVGFHTDRDHSVLGTGFNRHFPVPQDQYDFADLLARLNEIDVEEAQMPEGR